MDLLKDNFEKAAEKAKSLTALSNETKLKLYALFKQAKCGDCEEGKQVWGWGINTAKRNAWIEKNGLSKEQAMEAYIALVAEYSVQNGPSLRANSDANISIDDELNEPSCSASSDSSSEEVDEDTYTSLVEEEEKISKQPPSSWLLDIVAPPGQRKALAAITFAWSSRFPNDNHILVLPATSLNSVWAAALEASSIKQLVTIQISNSLEEELVEITRPYCDSPKKSKEPDTASIDETILIFIKKFDSISALIDKEKKLIVLDLGSAGVVVRVGSSTFTSSETRDRFIDLLLYGLPPEKKSLLISMTPKKEICRPTPSRSMSIARALLKCENKSSLKKKAILYFAIGASIMVTAVIYRLLKKVSLPLLAIRSALQLTRFNVKPSILDVVGLLIAVLFFNRFMNGGNLALCMMILVATIILLLKNSNDVANNRQAQKTIKHDVRGLTSEQIEKRIAALDAAFPISSPINSNRVVVVTGCTGFLGTAVLHELLREQKTLRIKKLILIARCGKRGITARQRVDDILASASFASIDETQKKVVQVLEGDALLPLYGIENHHLENIPLQDHETIVCDLAATIALNKPLRDIVRENVTTALNAQSLARRLDAMLIYCSTAYVHCNSRAATKTKSPRSLPDFGPFDPLRIYQELCDDGPANMAHKAYKELGFSPSYVFSKAIAEALLARDKSIKLSIVRPSVISPSWALMNGFSGPTPYTAPAVTAYLSVALGAANFWRPTHQDSRRPVVPVDVVARMILQSIPLSASEESSETPSVAIAAFGNQVLVRDATLVAFSRYSKKRFFGYSFRALVYRFVCFISDRASYNNVNSSSLAHRIDDMIFEICDFIFNTGLPRLVMRFGNAKFAKRWLLAAGTPRNLDLSTRRVFGFEGELETDQVPAGFSIHDYENEIFQHVDHLLQQMKKSSKSTKKSIRVGSSTWSENDTETQEIDLLAAENPWSSKLGAIRFGLIGARSRRDDSIFARVVGILVAWILKGRCKELRVNIGKLRNCLDAAPSHLVLLPTHRSLLDAVMLGFVAWCVPDLDLPIVPHFIADSEFSTLPFVNALLRTAGVVFVTRTGSGSSWDGSEVSKSITKLYMDAERRNERACFVLFLEGARSRDGRFLRARSGILRRILSDVNSSSKVALIPMSISIESPPDRQSLVRESFYGKPRSNLSMSALFSWVLSSNSDRNSIGAVDVCCSSTPLLISDSNILDASELAQLVQQAQMNLMSIPWSYVEASAEALHLDAEILFNGLKALGVRVLTTSSSSLQKIDGRIAAHHWLHNIAPLIPDKELASFLSPSCNDVTTSSIKIDREVQAIADAVVKVAQDAIRKADKTRQDLQNVGIKSPHAFHIRDRILDTIVGNNSSLFLDWAAERCGETPAPPPASSLKQQASSCKKASPPIEPIFTKILESHNNEESFGAWGYKDSSFKIDTVNGKPVVRMSGSRYPISGRQLPKLIPFAAEVLKIPPDCVLMKSIKTDKEITPPALPPSQVKPNTLRLLQEKLGAESVLVDNKSRWRHGTGQTIDDMLWIRNHLKEEVRMPDVVLIPNSEEDVAWIIQLASTHKFALIPFGGGTNVTLALKCPSYDVEPRPIAAVAMRKINKIYWLSKADGAAHIGAGANGAEIEAFLAKRGLTTGHEPDSFEFSTLGGWIATAASGMKRSKYGNIEDIVVSLRVATTNGIVWQQQHNGSIFSRTSTGLRFTSSVIGSEGCLGIVTSAVVKVRPIPRVRRFETAVFQHFEDGLAFVRAVATTSQVSILPVSTRLMDNDHFRLAAAFRDEKDNSMSALLKKAYVLGLRDFNPTKMVACTLVFEADSEAEATFQMKSIFGLIFAHGGLSAGPGSAEAGYQLTFAIAYLRDFMLDSANICSESLECTVPWRLCKPLINAVKAKVKLEHRRACLPGRALVMARVTQLYRESCCVYIYVATAVHGVADCLNAYSMLESAARNEVLRNGGSLSHHHGVGKLRAGYLLNAKLSLESPIMKTAAQGLKSSLDPSNIFAAGNAQWYKL